MEQLYNDLTNLGYDGIVDKEIFIEVFTNGPPNLYFVDIIAWLSSQLVPLCNLESCVTPVYDEDDLDNKGIGFLVEVSSLLKELGCPIKALTRGSVEARLLDPDDKMNTIMYLCQELQAGKILAFKKPKQKQPLITELDESVTAKELREMLISLHFGKPPDNIIPQRLFGEVEKKLYTLSQPSSPRNIVGELLFSGCLTEKQWFQLEKLYFEVLHEYKNRRNLLLTRLDVTIKSFLWAERLKNKSEEVMNIYNKKRSEINESPAVNIADILSAFPDLAVIEKTSSASVRKNTKSFINKHKIGPVPDRGGRPEEQAPPPPEIPSWQKSDNSSRGGSRQSFSSGAGGFKNSGDRGGYRNRNDNDDRSNSDRNSNYHNNRENSYRGGRVEYHAASFQPVYQAVPCYTQLAPGFGGFGGYMPAGDNFSQFGTGDGIQSQPNMNYQSKQRGGGHDRGGYDRGGGRGGYRPRGRGRGRW